MHRLLPLAAALLLALAAGGVVAAQTQGGDTTGPNVPVGGGGGGTSTTPDDGGGDSTEDREINRTLDRGDNTSWYERIKADDTQSAITDLPVASSGRSDPSTAGGASDFDREIRTNTMAGNVVPGQGVGPDVRNVDADPVHVVAQFDEDDPTVSAGGGGLVPGFVPVIGSSGPRDIASQYDLTPCGSYMHPAGWENAHCYGVPADELDGFLGDSSVRSVVHRDADWKLYPEIGRQLNESSGGERLVVETYPDAAVTADDLNASHAVNVTPQRHSPSTFVSAPVVSYGTARGFAENENVSWVEWIRPIDGSLSESREHVGANDLTGRAGDGGVGLTGDGALVGVLDSGIQQGHSHFDGISITESADWVDWGMPPEDETGHGTHVAGTIAGNSTTSDGTVLTGVAPEADLVVARGLNSNDVWATTAGRVLARGRFARMANDAPGTMDVISNSWGVDDTSRVSPFSRYGKFARSADKWALQNPETLVVFANGNACETDPNRKVDEIGCAKHVQAPALGKNVLSVGATWEDGRVSPLNDLNPPEDVVDLGTGRVKPEVLAPGEGATSTGQGITAPVPDGDYDTKRGTSMATPHVSGLVALIKEKYPKEDANGLRALLTATTSPVRNPNGFLEGYGEVNGHDALFDNNYESDQFSYSGEMTEGGKTVRTFDVPEGAHRIDATLAWMDPNNVAGGTKGFVFNRLDLKLDGPSSWHSNLDATNVKKLTVEDPEAGEWRLLVTGTNVGKWYQGGARQPYDGELRVIEDEPAVEVAVQTDEMRTAYRPRNLDDNDVRVGRGDENSFELKAIGTGSVVSDVDLTVNTDPAGGVEHCNEQAQRTFDAGDLSRSQEQNWTVCLNASSSASVGKTTVRVEVDSTNGVNSSGSTNAVDIPIFLTETQPPEDVRNVRSTTHTIDDWSADTTLRFEWDRASDRGGSGLDGYYRDLEMISPDATDGWNYTVETPSEDWPQYVDDPASTGVNISVAPDHCIDGDGTNETCFSTPADWDADGSYWFYIKAQDRSKVLGDRTAVGPYRIDTTPPEPFDVEVGDTSGPGRPDVVQTGTQGYYYNINGTSTEVLWKRPLDKSGIAEYSYMVTNGGSTIDSGTFTHEDVYIGPSWSVDSALSISGLAPGENAVQITAIDEAGNTRQAGVNICVEGGSCTTPAQAEQVREDVRQAEAIRRLGLDEPGRLREEGMLERRITERMSCPGTYLCGDSRPRYADMVANEDVLLRVTGGDGEVVGRYFAEMEDGAVTNVQRVDDPATVDQTVEVTTDAATLNGIVSSDDTMGAIGEAYEDGAIELSGVGLGNRLKYGALETGYGAYRAATGAYDAVAGALP